MRKLAILTLVFSTMSAAAAPAAKRYEGTHGGLTQSLAITRGIGGALHADIQVAGNGCGGEALGPLKAAGPKLTMARTDDGSECRITFTMHGPEVDVHEDGCGGWHGASCDFNGTLVATR